AARRPDLPHAAATLRNARAALPRRGRGQGRRGVPRARGRAVEGDTGEPGARGRGDDARDPRPGSGRETLGDPAPHDVPGAPGVARLDQPRREAGGEEDVPDAAGKRSPSSAVVDVRPIDPPLGVEVQPSITRDKERAIALGHETEAVRSEGEAVGIAVRPDAAMHAHGGPAEVRGRRLPGLAAVACEEDRLVYGPACRQAYAGV